MIRGIIGAASILLLLTVLWDAFEAVVLPRRVTRWFRPTRLFYRATWYPWRWLAKHLPRGNTRNLYLGIFGPLSLILLLVVWAICLVIGFGCLEWSLHSPINAPEINATLATDLYVSGTTFFTLGLGDVTPRTQTARMITIIESGTGFGFLALVIGYLPMLYQTFSRRETNITLLDARAGSPPTAAILLRRHAAHQNMDELQQFLRDWEFWCADLLESHLSYPVLAYYRSQHSNQSWIGALATVLDTCTLVLVGFDNAPAYQAQMTFAMARHVLVDLSQIFDQSPSIPITDRLPPDELDRLRELIAWEGMSMRSDSEADDKLRELRGSYEPYLNSLAEYLLIELPPWFPKTKHADNWQTSAWESLR